MPESSKTDPADEGNREKLTIYRAKDAAFIEDTDAQTVAPMTPEMQQVMGRVVAAGGTGAGSGSDTRLLFRRDGDGAVSLVHVWLKPNKPLPRHSHDSDCVYYVISGQVIMGSQTLGPGDGFRVPAGAPYAFRVGADGAEVLEFRTAAAYDLKLHDERAESWDQYIETVQANRDAWTVPSTPPSWR